MYAISEIEPCLDDDGKLSVFKVLDNDEEVCWFSFKSGGLADLIHAAFDRPTDYITKNGAPIPDEYMPAVTALILQMWHNWERLKEATKGAPLHLIKQKGNRIYVGAKQ